MTTRGEEIVRRDFKHGKVAYGFQWQRARHSEMGNKEGDLASLWAHLNSIYQGNIPEEPFTSPFYTRASRLKLKKLSRVQKVGFRKRLMKSGSIEKRQDDELVSIIRECHRQRNDNTWRAGHDILVDFLELDTETIAIEVPVWSERYQLSGHIDLIRFVDDVIEVCDYKPGSLERTANRFFKSIPQVSSYGEMLTHHLASTLRSALNTSLLPRVRCCIFDTHSCWKFDADMFVKLETTGFLDGL